MWRCSVVAFDHVWSPCNSCRWLCCPLESGHMCAFCYNLCRQWYCNCSNCCHGNCVYGNCICNNCTFSDCRSESVVVWGLYFTAVSCSEISGEFYNPLIYLFFVILTVEQITTSYDNSIYINYVYLLGFFCWWILLRFGWDFFSILCCSSANDNKLLLAVL